MTSTDEGYYPADDAQYSVSNDPAPLGPNAVGNPPGPQGRGPQERKNSHHISPEPQPVSALFRSGKTANRASRSARKCELIDRIRSLPGNHKKILKSLQGCGAARTKLITARRIAVQDRDVSGYMDGVIRCRKRLCPVCGHGAAEIGRAHV